MTENAVPIEDGPSVAPPSTLNRERQRCERGREGRQPDAGEVDVCS